MSHKHKAKIEKLFAHPLSTNIDVKKLLAALEHYGVEIEHTKKNKIRLSYSDEEEIYLALPHGDHLGKDEAVRLRHWLESIGVTPSTLG